MGARTEKLGLSGRDVKTLKASLAAKDPIVGDPSSGDLLPDNGLIEVVGDRFLWGTHESEPFLPCVGSLLRPSVSIGCQTAA